MPIKYTTLIENYRWKLVDRTDHITAVPQRLSVSRTTGKVYYTTLHTRYKRRFVNIMSLESFLWTFSAKVWAKKKINPSLSPT